MRNLIYERENGLQSSVFIVAGYGWVNIQSVACILNISVRSVERHVKNFEEHSLFEDGRHTIVLQVQRQEGSRSVTRSIKHYSQEAVILIGMKTNDERAFEFHKWVTKFALERASPKEETKAKEQLDAIEFILDDLGIPAGDPAARVAQAVDLRRKERMQGLTDWVALRARLREVGERFLGLLNQLISRQEVIVLPVGQTPDGRDERWTIGWYNLTGEVYLSELIIQIVLKQADPTTEADWRYFIEALNYFGWGEKVKRKTVYECQLIRLKPNILHIGERHAELTGHNGATPLLTG